MITYYQRYLRSDWWQARRLYELDRAGHCCEFCGSPDDQLHVHHLTYKRLNQELPEDLIVLCSSCHQDAHDFPGTIGFDIEGLAARRTTRGTYNGLIRWLERFIRERRMTDVGNELVVPVTGQIVDLDNPHQVAQVLYDIAEAQDQLKYFKRALVEALEPLRATEGKSTIELGDYQVVLTSNTKTEVDLPLLRELLTEAGLPEHRMDEVIEQTTTEKINWSVARQLRGANPAYAEALDKAGTEVPATVYANVTRGR